MLRVIVTNLRKVLYSHTALRALRGHKFSNGTFEKSPVVNPSAPEASKTNPYNDILLCEKCKRMIENFTRNGQQLPDIRYFKRFQRSHFKCPRCNRAVKCYGNFCSWPQSCQRVAKGNMMQIAPQVVDKERQRDVCERITPIETEKREEITDPINKANSHNTQGYLEEEPKVQLLLTENPIVKPEQHIQEGCSSTSGIMKPKPQGENQILKVNTSEYNTSDAVVAHISPKSNPIAQAMNDSSENPRVDDVNSNLTENVELQTRNENFCRSEEILGKTKAGLSEEAEELKEDTVNTMLNQERTTSENTTISPKESTQVVGNIKAEGELIIDVNSNKEADRVEMKDPVVLRTKFENDKFPKDYLDEKDTSITEAKKSSSDVLNISPVSVPKEQLLATDKCNPKAHRTFPNKSSRAEVKDIDIILEIEVQSKILDKSTDLKSNLNGSLTDIYNKKTVHYTDDEYSLKDKPVSLDISHNSKPSQLDEQEYFISACESSRNSPAEIKRPILPATVELQAMQQESIPKSNDIDNTVESQFNQTEKQTDRILETSNEDASPSKNDGSYLPPAHEKVQKNLTANIGPVPSNIDSVPLSVLLQRVRLRSHLEFCKLFENQIKTEDLEGKGDDPCKGQSKKPCDKQEDPCKSQRNTHCPPKASKPKENICTSSAKKSICKPNPSKKEDPCRKCVSISPIEEVKSILDAELIYPFPQSTVVPYEYDYEATAITSKEMIIEEIVNDILKPIGVSAGEFSDSIVCAREFDPWTPIPCWPHPHKQVKMPIRCPKEGCPAYRPPKDGDFCKPTLKPCTGFPKRATFSSIDIPFNF